MNPGAYLTRYRHGLTPDPQHTVKEFLECEDCGFVVLSESAAKPTPKRVDACPGCDGTNFKFTET